MGSEFALTRCYVPYVFHMLSLLLQKSRKIFDPADHDQPRKRKAVSPVVNVLDSNAAAPPAVAAAVVASVTTTSSLIDGSGCIYCGLTSPKQRKGGRQEALVRCKDCQTTGPSLFLPMKCSLSAFLTYPNYATYSDEFLFIFFLQCTLAAWITVKS